MKFRFVKLLLLTVAIPLFSCRNGHSVEVPPSLKSVEVEETRIQLPRGGSGELHFCIKDQLYRFAGLSDLVITGTSSRPLEGFSLTDLRSGEQEGHYVAVLTDSGSAEEYRLQARLGIRLESGSDALVLSAPFEVSNAPEAGPSWQQTGLPAVIIDTQDGAPVNNKEDWIAATLSLEGADYACSVRGRGNSTWEFPKKPYAIKLEKKASLLGMPSHKRWVLLANFVDRSLMRNITAMKVASLTSLEWSPKCRSVELVLNGRHLGNYLLIEQVKVDKNRVAVDEEEGFLLELDFHYDNEIQWMDPRGRCWQLGGGIPFGIKYPDPEDITPERVQQIKDYVAEVSSVIYGTSFADPAEGYAKYLDVRSFIDYWIVFEVMGNHELNNPGSVYMHKTKDGKLTAGPCWDFDWGVLSYKTSPAARSGLINAEAIWYSRLLADPAFRAALKARFAELLPALETVPDFMEQTQKELEKSAALNFEMWNPADDARLNGNSIINGDENISFGEACVRLRTIFEERLSVIQKSL